ncbi:hypothetical protein ACEUC4_21875, partial [Aeromonas hydrophila]
ESGAVAQPTTSEMSRIQAACQGIRRVPSGGIGECRTSKLNSRPAYKWLLAMVIATSWASQASAAVIKYNLVDADLRHFLFIENQEDHNLFITPTDYLDPRLTGGNAWTTDSRQVSLAYADNGHNYTVTNYNIDMWENGPVKYPYINQRCIKSWAGCDPQTAEAMNKPASVNETGFFGLMKAATGYAHAKLSSAFFDYLRTMPAGGILNREMNLCMTTRIYDAAAGERCINQDSGTWYVKRTQHKKAGHLRFIQTNAISEAGIQIISATLMDEWREVANC